MATVTDSATGIKTTYYYDFTGRQMKYVESGTGYHHSVSYEYDNINNLTRAVENINGVERTTSYTYDDDNRVKSKQTGNTKVTYTYDGFGRVSQQVTTNGTTTVLTESFTYNGNSSQIRTYATTAGGVTKTYTYTYDDNGNITSINDGAYTTTYYYDSANQLIREDNQAETCTEYWTYDNAGNILAFGYSPYGKDESAIKYRVGFEYANDRWGDLQTTYTTPYYSKSVTYDGVGNPLTDGTWTYTWQHGRQLMTMANGTETWRYTYHSDGLRLSRSNGTTTYKYFYNGSQLTGMTAGGNILYFSYDASGTPMSVNYNGTEYFYTSNIQGDVTGIVDSSGASVVAYSYDAWGNSLHITGTMASTLGQINPLRYRGYVYDAETKLYYLQSRYYDPEIGRFINADAFVSTGGLLGYNMYAYCLNNPTNMTDISGTMPKFLPEYLEGCSEIVETIVGELLYVREINTKGYLKEYWVDINGKVRWSRHHTNHGNSKEHPVVPHDHDWHDDDDGNNTQDSKWQEPNPGFKAPDSDKKNSKKIIAVATGSAIAGYVIYTGIKWAIAGIAAPVTGGGSLIVAGVTP